MNFFPFSFSVRMYHCTALSAVLTGFAVHIVHYYCYYHHHHIIISIIIIIINLTDAFLPYIRNLFNPSRPSVVL